MLRLCALLFCLSAALTLQGQANEDIVHTVSAGENLTSIANAYGVTLERLLSLNGLDPESYLQIGQRLLVIPAGGNIPPESESEADGADPTEADDAGSVLLAADASLAPVTEAAAPMMNPADVSPLLCFSVFEDDNPNGLREPGEPYLEGATILLFEEDRSEALRQQTVGAPQPHCWRELARARYQIEAAPPAGFGLTSAAVLRIDLRAGGELLVDFGAKRGWEAGAAPTPAATPTDLPAVEASDDGLLRELSGLFVLALAGVVLISGLLLALLLRGR